MGETSEISALSARLDLPHIAELVAGNGGLTKLKVATGLASAEIYLHGAQVTSWRPTGAEEVLFLSEKSHWQDGRAIRGGIPICFPWFRGKADNDQAPAHGFVRTRTWRLDSVTVDELGCVTARLSFASDSETRQWWAHEFSLEYRITIGKVLRMELRVRNTGSTTFSFEEALHTYFRVGVAAEVRVRGLDGAKYLDNTEGNREKLQPGDVTFERATDNAYVETRAACDLIDPVLKRTLRTEKCGSLTTVVWNPWQAGAAALSDLGDEEWRHMTCVEACNIRKNAVNLAPGEEHTMQAIVSFGAV